jgi:hypothetical protein
LEVTGLATGRALLVGLAVVGLAAADERCPVPNPHGGVLLLFAVFGRKRTGWTFVSYTFFFLSTNKFCSEIRRRMFATCFA